MYANKTVERLALSVGLAICLLALIDIVWPLPLTRWIDGHTAALVNVTCVRAFIVLLIMEVSLLPFPFVLADVTRQVLHRVLLPIVVTVFVLLLAHALGWEQQPMAVGKHL